MLECLRPPYKVRYRKVKPFTEEQEDEVVVEEPPKIPIDQVDTLQALCLHESQQPDGDDLLLIQQLFKHERVLRERKLRSHRQSDVRIYFQKKKGLTSCTEFIVLSLWVAIRYAVHKISNIKRMLISVLSVQKGIS